MLSFARCRTIRASEGWIAVRNEFPRVDALFMQPEHQIVFTPLEHIVDRIDVHGFMAIAHLRDRLVERLELKGFGICIREGERLWSGKTVPHVHAHLIQPQIVTLGDGTLHASTFNFPIGDREAPG